jgi:hypothetical protein
MGMSERSFASAFLWTVYRLKRLSMELEVQSQPSPAFPELSDRLARRRESPGFSATKRRCIFLLHGSRHHHAALIAVAATKEIANGLHDRVRHAEQP